MRTRHLLLESLRKFDEMELIRYYVYARYGYDITKNEELKETALICSRGLSVSISELNNILKNIERAELKGGFV